MTAAEPATTPRSSVAVGVGPVKLAAYLFNTSLAVRKGTNEIEYLPTAFWAERLDAGLQRVLAANLVTLLPTDQIRLSAWESGDVSVEVYVAIERFDVDANGGGVLVAGGASSRRVERRPLKRARAVSHARAHRRTLTRPAPSPR